MFLKKARNPFRSLSSRLASSFLLFFLLSVLLIFGVLFYSVESFLEQKDHDIIDARFQQYQQLYERDGLVALQQISKDPKLRTQSAKFLIHLKNREGQTIFIHFPDEIENFILSDLRKTLDQDKPSVKPSWFFISSKDGDADAMEVHAATLEGGEYLQVGSRTDSRDEIVERILRIFTFLLLPCLAIAVLGTIFIVKRSLSPIRHLIETVSSIKSGELSSRVPIHETHDELHELGFLFNEMIERLQGLMNAMRDTLDNLAHDLKTPITRLKAAGELALRSDNDQEIRSALSEAIENSEEISQLIESIMTVSEISTKTVRLQKAPFSLNQVIEEVVDVYFFVAEDKSMQIRFISDVEVELSGDRVLIKQAIANILDNALKYSPKGTEILIYLKKQDDKILIQIKDQGIGISESDLPRIWERLYRGDKSRHEPGLGLGLSMVRAIIETHDGQVEAQSEMNQGSVFTITLPQ